MIKRNGRNIVLEISSDYKNYNENPTVTPDGDHSELRKLVIDYDISHEKANKLIGKTEDETHRNIENYRATHKLPDYNKYQNDEPIIRNLRLGYTYDENGNVVVDKREARIINVIIKMHKKGYKVNRIKRRLEFMGVIARSGKAKWSWETIRHIIERENDGKKE